MSKPETNAIELDNGNYGCPNCKCDKFKFVAHMDGKDFYQDVRNCTKCGSVINFRFKRSKQDQMYWE